PRCRLTAPTTILLLTRAARPDLASFPTRRSSDLRDEGSRGTPAEPKRLMGDVALYRRLLRQARPYWPHFLALFAMGLLASLIALDRKSTRLNSSHGSI